MGAKIGKDVTLWAGGRPGLMTEPDLVTLGDRVSLDDCSVVAHINSRGKFALNKLFIADGCALRTGSRLLSGAQMEDYSMLLEHALLASGDIAEAGAVYAGWPAQQLDERRPATPEPSVTQILHLAKVMSTLASEKDTGVRRRSRSISNATKIGLSEKLAYSEKEKLSPPVSISEKEKLSPSASIS